MNIENEDAGLEELSSQELGNQFDEVLGEKIALERELTISNKQLARTKDFDGNHRLRTLLIEVLDRLSALALRMGQLTQEYKAEAAYHRIMLQRRPDEPLDVSLIQEALRVKEAVKKQF